MIVNLRGYNSETYLKDKLGAIARIEKMIIICGLTLSYLVKGGFCLVQQQFYSFLFNDSIMIHEISSIRFWQHRYNEDYNYDEKIIIVNM